MDLTRLSEIAEGLNLKAADARDATLLGWASEIRTMVAEESAAPLARPADAELDQIHTDGRPPSAAATLRTPRWTSEQIAQQVRESAAVSDSFL